MTSTSFLVIVGIFNRLEGRVQMRADIGHVLAHIGPEMALGDIESMLVEIGSQLGVVIARQALSYSSCQASDKCLKNSSPKM